MSLSANPLAYADCTEILERAMLADRGLIIRCENRGKARHLLARLNQCRVLDRRRMMRIREPADPTYGLSDYDVLKVSVRDSIVALSRHPTDASALTVEEL